MYIRTINVKIQPDKLDEARKIYYDDIVPEVKSQKGNIDIFLMESLDRDGEVISFTSWESQEDADRYEGSGTYVQMVNKIKHTFANVPTLWSYKVKE
jgi:quinol monooxygenase YgiN